MYTAKYEYNIRFGHIDGCDKWHVFVSKKNVKTGYFLFSNVVTDEQTAYLLQTLNEIIKEKWNVWFEMYKIRRRTC